MKIFLDRQAEVTHRNKLLLLEGVRARLKLENGNFRNNMMKCVDVLKEKRKFRLQSGVL